MTETVRQAILLQYNKYYKEDYLSYRDIQQKHLTRSGAEVGDGKEGKNSISLEEFSFHMHTVFSKIN